jgi:aspartate carbamoyltransferase regulatory subunit
MLLKIKATIKRISTPLSVRNYIPISHVFISSEPVTAIKAVAPPGDVFVNCIKTIEIETDKDAVNHMISGTNVATVTSTIAEMTWPPTKFRGWARGL